MESSSRTSFASDRWRSVAYKTARDSSQQSLDLFQNYLRDEFMLPINKHGDTVLHFLAIYGNAAAFRMLLHGGHLTSEDLMKKNVDGDSALHEAARFGQADVAEIMVKREKEMVFARNNLGETPLYVAAAHGKEEVFTILAKFGADSDSMMRRNDGSTILHAAVEGECYRFAITILELYPYLAQKRDDKGMTALYLLATQPSSFKSGTLYDLNMHGRAPFVPFQIVEVIIYSCIPPLYVESKTDSLMENPNDNRGCISVYERSSFTKLLLGFPWLKSIDESKQKHMLALFLAKRLVEKEGWSSYLHNEWTDSGVSSSGVPSTKQNSVPDPLIQATKHGIIELARTILKVYPEAADTFDENRRNILHIAVEQKNKFIYAYLSNNVSNKDRMMVDVDYRGNTVMHLAANKGTYPNVPPSPVFQLTLNVFWFKRIMYDSYGRLWHRRNFDGKTATELFEENHTELQKEAERTARELANGVMVVAALIGTINFAAIFTVPGGFNSETGLPILLKNDKGPLQLLMAYLGGALAASLLTLGTLLSVVLSRFHTEDFYMILPLKFLVTSIGLFCSAGGSVIACCQAFILEDAIRYFILIVGGVAGCCCWMGIIYIDAAFIVIDYIIEVVYYMLTYRGRDI